MSILGFLRKFPSRIASEWGLSNLPDLWRWSFACLCVSTYHGLGLRMQEMQKCRDNEDQKNYVLFPYRNRFDVHFGKKWPDTVVTRIVLLVALTLPYLDSTFSLPDSILHLGMSKLAILFDFFRPWPAPVHFFVLLFLILPFIEFNHPSQNVLIFNSFATFSSTFFFLWFRSLLYLSFSSGFDCSARPVACWAGRVASFSCLPSFPCFHCFWHACCACQQWCL